MKEYLVIFEWAGTNYSVYVPDLPGCVSTGKTIEEAEENVREAISLYMDVLRDEGKPIPEPTTKARPVIVAA
ncbi:MAG: type II toxin-antitoxin system HicB family antitoxin [Armatimonadetes bacterium]|nr:type II toxin-antitoxin system HicB family antitoxin [Armatimonadota bacterium]